MVFEAIPLGLVILIIVGIPIVILFIIPGIAELLASARKKKEHDDFEDDKEDEEEQEDDEETETYEKEIKCPNCGNEEYYDIPKGQTVEQFLKGKECKECGCALIKSFPL
jgi:cytochrome c-type biogenesis protein CcmH/NrfF